MPKMKGESSTTSPVLFLNTKGEPIRFYVRPGPTKVQLQPLITNGGGVLCRTQEPSAILLADPGDVRGGMESAGHFYISTQYIHDCVMKKQQLDMEKYRFNNVQSVQTRARQNKSRTSGRLGYSEEDDAAILSFMVKHKHEARGNRVWQQMERQKITNHSWQSMKDRYLKHLQQKVPAKTPEKKNDSRQKRKVLPLKNSPSSVEEISQPPPESDTAQILPGKEATNQSSDSDLTQITANNGDVQCLSESGDLQQNSSEVTQQEPCAERQDHDAPSEETQPQLQPDTEQAETSSKRARLESDVTAEDTPTGSSGQVVSPSPTEVQHGKTSTPVKRKLGILERAAREFEDSQDYSQEEDDDCHQDQTFSNTPILDPSEIVEAAAHELEVQEGEGNSEPHCSNIQHNGPQLQCDGHDKGAEEDAPVPGNTAVSAVSNAHMFLFESETQEEDFSQSQQTDPQSQDLVKAEQHILNLMRETKKSLVEVTKALLKTSGDVSLALGYLLEGCDRVTDGPLWTRQDDQILLSADRSEPLLLEKYGEERVTKRIAFLQAN
ncbi:telomeric repeat-binding factor 2-interacting protein 1 [Chanos chanos]|uniref:Telomeric repeat-binding factor 2-interacting protein 1 n=1 Tax=Chanos chanos TaxID=29144 RepID=A0A6J2VQW1_CHACN|nr:telomeric repeat-binding factor 2-interacting protein 1 [Chanos chanos]